MLLLTASARAQSGPEAVALALGGGAGGAALGWVAASVVPGDETAEAAAFVVLYPVGVTLGMSAVGHALGIDHSAWNTLGDASLGAALGAVVGAAVLYANVWELGASDYLDGSPLAVGAVAVFTAAPVALGLADFRAEPAVLATPGGGRVAGLALSLRL